MTIFNSYVSLPEGRLKRMVPQALKLTQTSNLIQSAPDAGYGSQHCRQGLKLGDVASDVTDGDPATLWLFNIAMENGPFIDGLPIRNGDFPWLC